MNVFSPHKVRNILYICDHSIDTFFMREICLGFSNTSRVDSLDRFGKSVVSKVKTEGF